MELPYEGLAGREEDDKEAEECDRREEEVISVVGMYQEEVPAVTWDRVKYATKKDSILSQLMETIMKGMPDDKQQMLRYLVGDVAIYKDRLVIPVALRGEVLEALHSAHHGVTGMHLWAGESVFWPAQLSAAREACKACTQSAPSQPSAPPTPLDPPEFPF